MTLQFAGMGETAIPLESVKPTGEWSSDDITIETLDSIGISTSSYTWITWGGESGEEVGWSPDGGGEIAQGVTIPVAKGLWVVGASALQGLQSAGEVLSSDVNVTLCEGHTLTGNPFPCPIALENIVPTGTWSSDDITIETLDSIGISTSSYTWITWGGESGEEVGWSPDGGGEIAQGVTFPVAQGLWVVGASDQQGLQFTASEL